MTPGFTGGPLDRADRLRHDAEAVAALARRPDARLLRLGPGYEPQPEGDRLGWGPVEDGTLVFLGLDGGVPCFAAVPEDGMAGSFRSPSLMAALAGLAPGEAATWAAARSVVDWHVRHGFCARCGEATAVIRAGWARRCPRCTAEHFPRTDPVVIMVAEHEGRALLGRQASWPAGRYSALAGFVEPGESVEEAVAREVWEEAGVRVTDVRYVASQPWPFPSQLMIACLARAESDALTVDRTELEDAIWVSRDQVRAVLAGEAGPFVPPPAYAIAHTLLNAWANG
jgi:NAD+ diphosphatase